MQLYDRRCSSRLILGTARYATPERLRESVHRAGVEVVTVSLRREGANGHGFWPLVRALGVAVLPNTAGCRTAKEAITTAHMARELFATSWLKLEVTGDEATLAPDPFATLEAATVLTGEGFQLFPYITCDLALAERLVTLGCRVLMPWASPIGGGRGLADVEALRALRERHPGVTMIVDAGIGRPSHAAQAMELGYDGVLLNTAVALADDPPRMAEAFALAVRAGHLGRTAGLLSPRAPEPSTPAEGRAAFP